MASQYPMFKGPGTGCAGQPKIPRDFPHKLQASSRVVYLGRYSSA